MTKQARPKGPEDQTPDFPDETAHLTGIKLKLHEAIAAAADKVEHYDQAYMEAKRYTAEHRAELDPRELFADEMQLNRIDQQGAFAVLTRDKLIKLLDSPYFARIDFQAQTQKQAVPYYIGRFAFTHEYQLHIVDWRAPLAGMFYDFEVGAAAYTAPSGTISGELTRKRQFKIKHGEIEYVLESSVNIQDDVLQRELSHTSDEKMKSIIATIQKEQNSIIRNESADTLIIQGVAGSGKTSIALHRIAYLLYRFKNRINAKNVMILSPNRVFGDYIANVLPELGEEPIFEMSFADIAELQLDGVIAFEPDADPLEQTDAAWQERVRYKSTLAFVQMMDNYLAQMPAKIFAASDCVCGSFRAGSEFIADRFAAYSKYPLLQRLQMMADDILDLFAARNLDRLPLPKAKIVLKNLTAMLRVQDTLSLYRDFFHQAGIPEMFVQPDAGRLEWADVYPFLYFHAAFAGLTTPSRIRHLVIDEMQDYTPAQYAVMNLLFPCPKTILGDFGQFINPNHSHTLADLSNIYAGAELVELNKSYRSTYEIINFAKRILHIAKLEPMERHGEEPALVYCQDKQAELAQIQERIAKFLASDNVTLGIITKTASAAKELYNSLSADYEVHLLSDKSSSFKNGISITSVQMAKGLEFDEVIIAQANSATYANDYDRSLLYIACTRAMHSLTLTYSGELTPLIS